MKIADLQVEIEECRQEMLELSATYSLTSDIVVKISKQLDELMNRYNRMHHQVVGSTIN